MKYWFLCSILAVLSSSSLVAAADAATTLSATATSATSASSSDQSCRSRDVDVDDALAPKPDLVMGICGSILAPDSNRIGLRMFNIRTFLLSLRYSGSRAHVVFFIGEDHAELSELALEYDVELVKYNATHYNITDGSFSSHRFRLYREYLWDHKGMFNRIIVSDVRDVLFQLDPFEYIDVHNGLVVARENMHTLIGQCFWHNYWFRGRCLKYINEKVMDSLASFPRSCSGTVMGTFDAVFLYSVMMEQENYRLYNKEMDDWCPDQALHNYLLHNGYFSRAFNVTMMGAEDSHLCTFGDYKTYNMDDRDILNEAGFAPAIVHQYDRAPYIVHMLYEMYGNDEYVCAELCTKHPQLNGREKYGQSWKEGQCYVVEFGKKPIIATTN